MTRGPASPQLARNETRERERKNASENPEKFRVRGVEPYWASWIRVALREPQIAAVRRALHPMYHAYLDPWIISRVKSGLRSLRGTKHSCWILKSLCEPANGPQMTKTDPRHGKVFRARGVEPRPPAYIIWHSFHTAVQAAVRRAPRPMYRACSGS